MRSCKRSADPSPVLPPQRPHLRQSRFAASRKQVPPIEAGSRPGSPARSEAPAPVPRPAAAAAPPPAKPLCGEPEAGTSNRSRQPAGTPARSEASAPVPPSLVLPPQRSHPRQSRFAASRKPLPGFRPRRKEAESFFPATCAAGKIPLTERRVKRDQPYGLVPLRAKAECTAPPASPEGPCAIVPSKGQHGAFSRRNVPRYIPAKSY